MTALLLVLGGIYLYSFGLRIVYRHWGLFFLKPAQTQWPDGAQEKIKAAVSGLHGKIVWSSSRSGNHQIYLLTLPDLRTYQLTTHPHVDYYPRISPEGGRILFARSQKRWVSERDQRPWDVYLLELSSGKEFLVARNGNFPNWLPDGRHISFLRGDQVLIKALNSERENVIFDGRRPPYEAEPQTPELSPRDSNLLAVTLRGKLSGVFVLHLSSNRYTRFGENSCELTWTPDGRGLIWVEAGGRGGTCLFYSSLDQTRRHLLMDLPLDFSHEYFPKLSNDGKWLVWGASRGDHEHDLADYELFLWKLGRPWEEALRITYNPANDRWPDIYVDPSP